LEQGAARELALLFSDSAAQASCVYPSMQLDSRLAETNIVVANDRLSASALFEGHVQLGAPITGNGTLEQMARLQGASSTQWWEQGVYAVQYVKVQSAWKIDRLNYHPA
jgi:hypothetical protein